MASRKLKYSKEEFAKRGDEIYESQVRKQVEAGNKGKIVVIDIETDDFAVAEDSLSASKKLRERLPDALFWFVRIGHNAVFKVEFGGSTEIRYRLHRRSHSAKVDD